jgi:hypothetical protein
MGEAGAIDVFAIVHSTSFTNINSMTPIGTGVSFTVKQCTHA